MRTFIFVFFCLLASTTGICQTVSTFDTLTLHGADTEYVNYSSLGSEVGFNDGLAHFPCYFDTSYGEYLWYGGFVYSNWTDSVSSPDWADSITVNPGKQYAAKAGIGYGGSAKYAVVYCSNPVTFANSINMNLLGAAIGQPVNGFYITNTSYAYSSMKYGDQFDTAFHTGDWFLLTVKGYIGGTLTVDSVNFYLADYRSANPDSDYIVTSWEWLNLLPLGHVDSLQFTLSSSNTTGGYLDVPAYFCMDNFTTNETGEGVRNVFKSIAKVYPSPATNSLNVDFSDNSARQLQVENSAGYTISTYVVTSAHMEINTANLPAGVYFLVITGEGNRGSLAFVKQ